MTLTIYMSALSFIISSAPITIASGYFLNELKSSETGLTWMSFFNIMRFARFKFFIMLFFNNKFRKELKGILAKKSSEFKTYISSIFSSNNRATT